MYTIIGVQCIDQQLTISNQPVLAAGGVEESIVQFSFCPLWDGFAKTAVFWQDEKNPYKVLIDSNNECVVPSEVTVAEGKMYFGVFGVNGETTRTTTVIAYSIKKGVSDQGSEPDPTPSIYEQILSELATTQQMLTGITDSVTAAQKAAENAAADAKSAANDAANALTTDDKAVPGGVATLDESGKVLSEQLPSMNYIPTDDKAVPGGVATLDENGKVLSEQLPETETGATVQAVQVTLSESWITTGSSTTPSSSICDYYQTVTVNGVTAENTIIVGLASTATAAQREAAEKGKIFAYSQAENSIIVCVGVDAARPETQIPITVFIWE